MVDNAKDFFKPVAFYENIMKKAQPLIAAKSKKPPGLTPVAFKGALLFQPSLPRA